MSYIFFSNNEHEFNIHYNKSCKYIAVLNEMCRPKFPLRLTDWKVRPTGDSESRHVD